MQIEQADLLILYGKGKTCNSTISTWSQTLIKSLEVQAFGIQLCDQGRASAKWMTLQTQGNEERLHRTMRG